MAIATTVPSLITQTQAQPWARVAVPYLQDLLNVGSAVRADVLALKAGSSFKRPLGQGLVAIEQAYVTAPRGPQKFETHVRNIDIQMVVSGREWMDVGPLASFQVSEPYSDERDVTFYHSHPASAQILADPGIVAVFFPDDAHRSQISVEDPVLTHKVVIKVPIGS
jgi:biofilm protein TabA